MTPIRVRVEQAVAFGRSLEWICEHLHVETRDVDSALRRIEAAHNYRDQFQQDDILTVPLEHGDRPLSSFYGPAEPSVIAELIDAICPRQHRPVLGCGSVAAYRRHQRAGEPIDDACRLAENRAHAARTPPKRRKDIAA